MESTDTWKRDDATVLWALYLTFVRRVALQRHVRSVSVIVGEVITENPLQMISVQDDHVVETFTAYRADDSLGVRILPRRTRRDEDFFDAHAAPSKVPCAFSAPLSGDSQGTDSTGGVVGGHFRKSLHDHVDEVFGRHRIQVSDLSQIDDGMVTLVNTVALYAPSH